MDLHKKYHSKAEASNKQMILEVIKGRIFHIQVNKESFFCSEWIALTYMELGLINRKRPYNAYMPKDFSDKNNYLKLCTGKFGEQVSIEIEHS